MLNMKLIKHLALEVVKDTNVALRHRRRVHGSSTPDATHVQVTIGGVWTLVMNDWSMVLQLYKFEFLALLARVAFLQYGHMVCATFHAKIRTLQLDLSPSYVSFLKATCILVVANDVLRTRIVLVSLRASESSAV